MEKFIVIVTNTVTDAVLVKMVVNKSQKIAIEHLFEHECFDPNSNLLIIPEDGKWKEFC